MEFLVTFLETAAGSDVFAAGIALGMTGGALALLAGLCGRLAALMWRRISVSVSLDNRSDAFDAFSQWLAEGDRLARSRRLRVDAGAVTRDGETQAPALLPGYGRHWLLAEGHLLRLDCDLNERVKTGGVHGSQPLETYDLTLIGPRPRAALTGWIAEGQRIARHQRWTGPMLHVHGDGYWQHCGALTPRALDSVLGSDDTPARLAADLARFFDRRDWYAARGVPWRRGYLLHGPPGTGKSSLIRALASHLRRDLALIDIGRRSLSDDDLREALAEAPPGALIVVEDIDAIFTGRDRQAEGVSFSGLLNALDGVAAQEGRALLMTTNHPERLDPALIRPGRVDVRAELGLVGPEVAQAMFLRFFPGEQAGARAFAAGYAGRTVSPAELQAALLLRAEAPEAGALAAE